MERTSNIILALYGFFSNEQEFAQNSLERWNKTLRERKEGVKEAEDIIKYLKKHLKFCERLKQIIPEIDESKKNL